MDAEKSEFVALVKTFEIRSYPSYLFMDRDGELIAKEGGYKTVEKLGAVCQKVLSFIDDSPLSKLTNGNIRNLTDQQLDTIVMDYSNYNFSVKDDLKELFYERLSNNNPISDEAYLFLVSNYKLGEDYQLLIDNFSVEIGFLNQHLWDRGFRGVFAKLFEAATISNNN